MRGSDVDHETEDQLVHRRRRGRWCVVDGVCTLRSLIEPPKGIAIPQHSDYGRDLLRTAITGQIAPQSVACLSCPTVFSITTLATATLSAPTFTTTAFTRAF